jgi:hypothetical protein
MVTFTKPLWKSNISLPLSQKEKSLAPKLTDWQPFKLQNSNGHGHSDLKCPITFGN